MSQPTEAVQYWDDDHGEDWTEDAEAARQCRLAALHMLAEQSLQFRSGVVPAGEISRSGAPSGWQRPTHGRDRSSGPGGRIQRSRLWLVALVLIVALLAASAAFALPALRAGRRPNVSAPAPVVADADRLYFDPDVPWTTVLVDGRSVAVGRPEYQAPLALLPGQHIIAWNAAPFPVQQCALSVPVEASDTCLSAFEGVVHVPGERPAEILHLGEHSEDLSQSEFAALESGVEAVLAATNESSAVQPGEPVYPGVPSANDGTYSATTRMQLDVQGSGQVCQLDLFTAAQNCAQVSNQCLPICSLDYSERQSLGSALPRDQWLTIAAVWMLRDFTSSAGQTAYPQQVLSSGAEAFKDRVLLVGLRWQDGSWRAQLFIGTRLLAPGITDPSQRLLVDPACAAAEAYFAEYLSSTERRQYSQVRFVSGANISAGCLIQATLATGGEPAEYFERFGVLLALNSTAQLLHPTMPVAGTYVRQLASLLATAAVPAIPTRYPANDGS